MAGLNFAGLPGYQQIGPSDHTPIGRAPDPNMIWSPKLKKWIYPNEGKIDEAGMEEGRQLRLEDQRQRMMLQALRDYGK